MIGPTWETFQGQIIDVTCKNHNKSAIFLAVIEPNGNIKQTVIFRMGMRRSHV